MSKLFFVSVLIIVAGTAVWHREAIRDSVDYVWDAFLEAFRPSGMH